MQLSKIIKHLQAQLDQQEEAGDQLREELAAANDQIAQLQDAVAGYPGAMEQVCCFAARLDHLRVLLNGAAGNPEAVEQIHWLLAVVSCFDTALIQHVSYSHVSTNHLKVTVFFAIQVFVDSVHVF